MEKTKDIVSHHDNDITTLGLSKSYVNFKAINSLAIRVDAGDIFGFLGPNGAGKTTTIRMLCGLILPSSGTAKVAGFDIIKDSLKIRRIVGLLPENSGFYGWMNAEEYLLHFASLYNIDPDDASERAKDLLEKVGLSEKAFAPISYYSRGMKQRLGLARALINDPRIIFLDEPTLGLDPGGQVQIRKILLELNREKGVTIFLSSHALVEVSSLCNKIAIIDRGSLLAQGSMDELKMRAGISQKIVVRIVDTSVARQKLWNLPLQANVNPDDSGLISITISNVLPDGNNSDINCIIDFCMKNGLKVYDIQRQDTSLEEIFFKMTGSSTLKGNPQLRKENQNRGGQMH